MKIAKTKIMEAVKILQQMGDIPMKPKMNALWVKNYNILVKAQNEIGAFITEKQQSVQPPPTYQKEFLEIKEKYAMKDEGIIKQIKEKQDLIDAIDTTDIKLCAEKKEELKKLEEHIYVHALDANGQIDKWDFHVEDTNEEAITAVNDFRDKYKEFYFIKESKNLPVFKEEWDKELKDYYNDILAKSNEINDYMKESIDFDFERLPLSFMPDAVPPNLNFLFMEGSPIMAMFFQMPTPTSDNGKRKGAGGKVINMK